MRTFPGNIRLGSSVQHPGTSSGYDINGLIFSTFLVKQKKSAIDRHSVSNYDKLWLCRCTALDPAGSEADCECPL